ncbi:MAG: hypothetical protein DCC58_16275 [Chloroflexi bacterium]|nr:MAG: hypothetical protein DCC58_16275 [Chloroflexota bacterium]
MNDAQCPPGQQCVTTNCALIACTSDDGNLLCIDGYYRARCNHCATTGCGECESCNADSGKCEPISYWEEVGCGNGGICCGGVCCDGDQCGCVSLDEDDPTQEYCTFGNAITCNSDDECFPNQYCQQSNNFCINVACETDGDCPIGIGCYIPVGSDTGYCRILCSDCRYSSSCDECFECNEDTGVCEFDCTDEEEECCPDDCACIETYPAGTACIDPNVTTNNVCSEQEPDACGAGEVCGIDDVCYAACVD